MRSAKSQCVHGLPWLSCMTLPAISLELECSREPAWGTLGTYTRESITDLPGIAVGWVSMQPSAPGLRSAGEREQLPCISKGCSKRGNCTPLSLRRRGLQGLQSEMGL